MLIFGICVGFLLGCLFMIGIFYWCVETIDMEGVMTRVHDKFYKDGSYTIKSGETFTCERDMFWETLTIEDGAKLNQNGFRVHAKKIDWGSEQLNSSPFLREDVQL